MKRATLVLATSVAFLMAVTNTYAARRDVPAPDPWERIFKPGAPSGGSFQTPAGESAYYGPEYVDKHQAGGRFQPGSGSSTTVPKQEVKVKPTFKIDPKKAAGKIIPMMKNGNIPGMAVALGIGLAVEQIGGFIEDNQIKVPSSLTPVPGGYEWSCRGNAGTGIYCDTNYQTAQQFIEKHKTARKVIEQTSKVVTLECISVRSSAGCNFVGQRLSANRVGSACPAGSAWDESVGGCMAGSAAARLANDEEYGIMQAYMEVQDSDYIKDIVQRSCDGSLSPSSCVQELGKWGELVGPKTQTGPATTTSTTTTRADGTTARTSTTTQNTYTYNYGDNFYTYNTKTRKTTINPDGTVSVDETTSDEPENEPETEEIEAPEIGSPLQGVLDKYAEINTDLQQPANVPSMINYSAWYSFGGSCSEISFEIPVMGTFSTDFCPRIEGYVQPILAFIFWVSTFIYCFGEYQQTIRTVRPL